eukprot:3449649-Rhodomonas_salina.2
MCVPTSFHIVCPDICVGQNFALNLVVGGDVAGCFSEQLRGACGLEAQGFFTTSITHGRQTAPFPLADCSAKPDLTSTSTVERLAGTGNCSPSRALLGRRMHNRIWRNAGCPQNDKTTASNRF